MKVEPVYLNRWKDIAKLIEEAAKLDSEIKELELRLALKKKWLVEWWSKVGKNEGKKFDTFKSSCQFATTKVYDPISTDDLYDKFKKMGQPENFLMVVKPEIASLRKFLCENDIILLRGPSIGEKISVTLKLKE